MGRPTTAGGETTKDMMAPAAKAAHGSEKNTARSQQRSGILKKGLAQNAHGLLHRAIGKAEQHRVLARREAQWRPRRHDEGVARPEGETLFADLGRAVAFNDAVDGAVGRAMR